MRLCDTRGQGPRADWAPAGRPGADRAGSGRGAPVAAGGPMRADAGPGSGGPMPWDPAGSDEGPGADAGRR